MRAPAAIPTFDSICWPITSIACWKRSIGCAAPGKAARARAAQIREGVALAVGLADRLQQNGAGSGPQAA